MMANAMPMQRPQMTRGEIKLNEKPPLLSESCCSAHLHNSIPHLICFILEVVSAYHARHQGAACSGTNVPPLGKIPEGFEHLRMQTRCAASKECTAAGCRRVGMKRAGAAHAARLVWETTRSEKEFAGWDAYMTAKPR